MPNSESYLSWPSVTEIFPLSSVGIVTARDDLHPFHETPAKESGMSFKPSSGWTLKLAREAFQLGKDAETGKSALAQQDLRAEEVPPQDIITPILYRPFDVRYTYLSPARSRRFH
jgi:hypothetical protein